MPMQPAISIGGNANNAANAWTQCNDLVAATGNAFVAASQYCFQNRTGKKVLYYISTSATPPTDNKNGLEVKDGGFSEVFKWVAGDYLHIMGIGQIQVVKVA